jgi:beta-carotene hydroxylase
MSTTPQTAVPAAARPRISADPLYHPGAIAWPTMLLFVAAAALWGGCLYAVLHGWIAPLPAVLLQTVAVFMQFTVLHDGVHRSLARGYPLLNFIVTNLAGAFLGLVGVGAAFRYVHFKHHRHTNESGDDPDLWSGKGSPWLMPLHWATADFCYAWVILKEWGTIPWRERLLMLGGVGFLAALFSACALHGWAREALLYWILPGRLAITWLAFAFNYLPHHPHEVEQRHNPYAATNIRRGPEPLMRWLFLYQNYHLIHHLFPSVPFYRYARIWARNQAEFQRQGAPVVPWHSPFGPER